MSTDWVNAPEVIVPEDLVAAIGGHPLVASTLVRRGMTDPEQARAFLDPDLYQPCKAGALPGMDRAVERLERAIRTGERICVWGDFDLDGLTATALLVSTLQELGATATYHIPVRQTESHGITVDVLASILDEGADLVLTCDTGVKEHEAIAYARTRGVDVVITDHHELPEELPQAHAIVDPRMLEEGHPLRDLAGVGCAFKVAQALLNQLGRGGEEEGLLDLVALGTVADAAPLRADTRFLVQRGLAALRKTERVGLQALIDAAQLAPERISEVEIGFQLAPRLNALGRMGDASRLVDLLLTDDVSQAGIQALELEGVNARRRMRVKELLRSAVAQIERNPNLLAHSVLVVGHPAWESGLVGLVAGRLAERYHRPAIVLTMPPDQMARGSVRSVEGCNIIAAITEHKDMLHRFGGHPMAAGLSLEPENVDKFRHAVSQTVSDRYGDSIGRSILKIDGHLALSDISLGLAEEFEQLAPFGNGNPSLTLATRNLRVVSSAVIGRTREHRSVTVEDENETRLKVMWWFGAEYDLPEGRFDLAYTLKATTFRGEEQVQVAWVDAQPIEEEIVTLAEVRQIDVIDRRRAHRPSSVLTDLRDEGDIQVWAEAQERANVEGVDRTELAPGRRLAIWTTPPSRAVLEAGLKKTSPEIVYLFARDPGLDSRQSFLVRLAGLVKHAVRAEGGRVSLNRLAAATAQRKVAVEVGLAWLEARGDIVIAEQGRDRLRLESGDGEATDALSQIDRDMVSILRETAAYREHFSQADAFRLLDCKVDVEGK